jgi:hypothetical protein
MSQQIAQSDDLERRVEYLETQESNFSAMLPPTEIGQVIYTTDGATWSAELPLTGPYGWLVNDDGILIVVG